MLWVLGWRSKNPYHCTPRAGKGVFGSPGWVSLKCTMPKNMLWFLGWRSKNPYHCTPQARKGVFGYLGWVSLERTMPENIVWVLGWRLNHPYHCTPQASKGVFWIPRMVMLELHSAKKFCLGSRVAPQTPIHTTVPHRLAKVFLDT